MTFLHFEKKNIHLQSVSRRSREICGNEIIVNRIYLLEFIKLMKLMSYKSQKMVFCCVLQGILFGFKLTLK